MKMKFKLEDIHKFVSTTNKKRIILNKEASKLSKKIRNNITKNIKHFRFLHLF